MKLVEKRKYNTLNAWGFGGSIGVDEEYDNGLIIDRGTAYYRHSGSTRFGEYRVRIHDNFTISVEGSVKEFVHIFQKDDHYYAMFSDKAVVESHVNTFTGLPYPLFKTIQVTF